MEQRHDDVISSHVLKRQPGESMATAFKNAAIELAAELGTVSYLDVQNRWFRQKNRGKKQKQRAEVKELLADGADDDKIASAVLGFPASPLSPLHQS